MRNEEKRSWEAGRIGSGEAECSKIEVKDYSEISRRHTQTRADIKTDSLRNRNERVRRIKMDTSRI
jgi:hypothetical protein